MSSPSWDEYLAQASAHLSAARASVEAGEAVPGAPDTPRDELPDGLRDAALRLSEGFDQLALEVAHRMEIIEQSRSRTTNVSVYQENREPRFFDAAM